MRHILYLVVLIIFSDLSAQTKTDSLQNLLSTSKEHKKATILNELARSFYTSSQDQGLIYAHEALDLAKKFNNDTEYANALVNLGNLYWASSEYSSSLKYRLEALNYWKEKGNPEKVCQLLINIGFTYDNISEYEKAMSYYHEALKIGEKNNFKELLSKTYNNICLINIALKKYDQAIINIEKSIDIGKSINDTIQLPAKLNNLGLIYEGKNDLEKAIENYKKALELNIRNKSQYGMSISLYNIGIVEQNLGNNTEAKKYFLEALELSKKIEDKYGVLLAYKSIGVNYKKQKDYNKAEEYLLKSLYQANKLETKDDKLSILKELSELNKEIGNSKQSLEYLEQYISLNDTIYSEQSMKQITEMQTKYETQKKENEIALLTKENQLQTSIKNSFIILSSLIMVIVLILLNQFHLKKKANKSLTHKNKIISEQRDQLRKAVQTKDRFFRIIAHDLKSPFNSILGLSELLHNNYIELDKDKRVSLIHELKKSAKSAYSLLENLLQWAQTQTGDFSINKVPVEIHDHINKSIEPYKLNAKNKRIEIINKVPENTVIKVDLNASSIILGNLVNNAIKFTNEGGHISIENSISDNFFNLHVIDSGIGIAPEILDKLFEPDSFITTNGTNNEKGTGLGLLICHEFTKKHGGNLRVKSEPGKGCEFIVSLPM